MQLQKEAAGITSKKQQLMTKDCIDYCPSEEHLADNV